MNERILLNIHEAYRQVIALCDEDLYGTILKEGNKKLDLTGTFFKGKTKNEKEITEAIEKGIEEDATFNIVGTKAINIAKKTGIINDNGIMTINKVPYALVLV